MDDSSGLSSRMLSKGSLGKISCILLMAGVHDSEPARSLLMKSVNRSRGVRHGIVSVYSLLDIIFLERHSEGGFPAPNLPCLYVIITLDYYSHECLRE